MCFVCFVLLVVKVTVKIKKERPEVYFPCKFFLRKMHRYCGGTLHAADGLITVKLNIKGWTAEKVENVNLKS